MWFEEGNKLIADYLNWTMWNIHTNCYEIPKDFLPEDLLIKKFIALYPYQMKFHSSRDWLYEAINKIGDEVDDLDNSGLSRLFELGIFSPIEDVYEAVVDYIKGKNENK